MWIIKAPLKKLANLLLFVSFYLFNNKPFYIKEHKAKCNLTEIENIIKTFNPLF